MQTLLRLSAVAMLIVGGAVPLSAQLRIRSQVEVTSERKRPAGMFAELALIVVPFQAAPGKADVVTLVARGAVRVEGLGPVLGLAPDLILLAPAAGAGVWGLVPSRGEYFAMPQATPASLSPLIGSQATASRHGAADVLLGQPTERVTVSVHVGARVAGQSGARVYDSRSGRMVDAWTIDETPEQRSRRLARGERSRAESSRDDPITIESWETEAFGSLAHLAATSRSAMTWFATGGYASMVEQRFPLRQIIRNPTYGYRVETRVLSVDPLALGDDLFEVPSHYRRVATPARPRCPTCRP